MIGPSEFLRKTAPDFMWCTVQDLFLMYEQINWDIDFDVFKQTFYRLFCAGEFFRKPDANHRRSGKLQRRLYLRKNAN